MRRAIVRLNYEVGIMNNASKNHNSEFITHNSRVMVLVDGPYPIAGLDLPQRAIIKGDQKIFAIACASILAKVHRDRMMVRYAKRWPEYGFERHKGYGTSYHRTQLTAFGPSEIHRKSFGFATV